MLTGIFISTPLFFLALAARGHVLAVLWKWFLIPLGAPAIGIPLALGIALMVSITATNPFAATNKDFDALDSWQQSLASILISYVALGFAWVLTQLM